MGTGTRAWTQKEWAQPSSTACQPRDLKGSLPSLSPGFPIINNLSGRSRELRKVPMHRGMLGQLLPAPSPSSLSLPTVCFGLGLASRGGESTQIWFPPAEAGLRDEFNPGNNLLSQESAHSSLGPKSGCRPAFVNNVLLERSRAHSYMFYLQLLSHHIRRAE